MSLFLGKIHYILYNKILWFEGIEEKIIIHVKKKGMLIDDLINHINQHFGEPLGNKPLEEVIDTTNIHGWLQSRIENAELRHAALITELLTWNPNYKAELVDIFSKQGEDAANEYKLILKNSDHPNLEMNLENAQQIYQALNEYILEGMPCDRVNEIQKAEDDEFVWQTTRCLHRKFWDIVGGDVSIFYLLREAWISAFVSTTNTNYIYKKTTEGLNAICRTNV